MPRPIFIVFLQALTYISFSSCQEFSYKINTTWDNQIPSDHPEISIELYPFSSGLGITIKAPFYNDPEPPVAPVEEPYIGLWDFEVVELFFLGDNEEYLELEFSPSGHYLSYYLKGVRNVSENYMPLKGTYQYEVEKNDTHWAGYVEIPGDYFPCNSNRFKMNAYAIHKSGEERRYMSLYPVKNGEIPEPNFHYLEAFEDISFTTELNPFCEAAKEKYEFRINTTWNGELVEDEGSVYLQYFYSRMFERVSVQVLAPFYNDPAPPEETNTSHPFPGLGDYEVVETYFLGDEENYLEIKLSPSGHYLIHYNEGVRNVINGSLPVTSFTAKVSNPNLATLEGRKWFGVAYMSSTYFPCNVGRMNAYAAHGLGEERRYLALYPVENAEIPGPDFHYLDGFKGFQFGAEVNPECRYQGTTEGTVETESSTVETGSSTVTTEENLSTTDNGTVKSGSSLGIILLVSLIVLKLHT